MSNNTREGLKARKKRLEALLECAQGDLHQQERMYDELSRKCASLTRTLEKIAAPHNCGCVPCTGGCKPDPQELVDEFQELAALALKSAGV
jgi:hypothetical protein